MSLLTRLGRAAGENRQVNIFGAREDSQDMAAERSYQEVKQRIHQRIVDEIHAAGKLAGIALNPGTSAYALDALLPTVDMVLVMSVNPGFGGQKFIPETPEKIRTILRLAEAHGAHPLIEVDGGISKETAGLVASAGARLLVAGSAVFKAEDRHKAMAEIAQAAQSGLGRKA